VAENIEMQMILQKGRKGITKGDIQVRKAGAK